LPGVVGAVEQQSGLQSEQACRGAWGVPMILDRSS
jgi:hypothetical protein